MPLVDPDGRGFQFVGTAYEIDYQATNEEGYEVTGTWILPSARNAEGSAGG